MAGVVSATAVPSAAATDRIRVLQANICGAQLYRPECPAQGGDTAGPVPYLLNLIPAKRYDVVTLNEICESQYETLKKQLAERGWRMDGRFAAGITDLKTSMWQGRYCGVAENGARGYGVAVLTSSAITSHTPTDLGRPDGDETRQLLCADTSLRGRSLRACVTHLSQHGYRAGPQAKAIAERPEVAQAEMAVILGGDFNLTPGSDGLGHLYRHSGGSGQFREIADTTCLWAASPCRGGEATQKFEKIDYVFASDCHFEDPYARILDSGTSDHRFLSGSVRPRQC
ncbi:endonuclease/exonuclease/phosphatase family protein [Paractinoplanes lichenicola]|uniref:Endonuclease/exonuclease/phosphatase family protein n=1 Tax=Paractinoplanes lichenicola TaxID=2802976 RepID=A0ABS1VLN4_9ACTN|nr:endonuclease/exonuclease/phosphatase family protein [Actinoplanes lichenicola]MBL7255558.1 endonuclease/exonuclease/phosphatase family protein [Actinoplanes lichenicola]